MRKCLSIKLVRVIRTSPLGKLKDFRRSLMYAKAVKLVSIAAFFLMFIWWFAAKSQLSSVGDGGYMELLALAVFSGALLLVAQTALSRNYFWTVAFAPIAVLFNPFAPLTLPRTTFLVLDAVCIWFFILSLTFSWREPRNNSAVRNRI